MAQTEATRNKLEALTVVAATCASLFVGVAGYIINQHGQRLDSKDQRITTLEISYATTMEHVINHENTANHWISVIKDCQKSRGQLASRLDHIEGGAMRPDPFTGAQGKKLEGMINELRQQLYTPGLNMNEQQN